MCRTTKTSRRRTTLLRGVLQAGARGKVSKGEPRVLKERAEVIDRDGRSVGGQMQLKLESTEHFDKMTAITGAGGKVVNFSQVLFDTLSHIPTRIGACANLICSEGNKNGVGKNPKDCAKKNTRNTSPDADTRTIFSCVHHGASSAHFQCGHTTLAQGEKSPHHFECFTSISFLDVVIECPVRPLPFGLPHRHQNLQRPPHPLQGVVGKAQAHSLAGVSLAEWLTQLQFSRFT